MKPALRPPPTGLSPTELRELLRAMNQLQLQRRFPDWGAPPPTTGRSRA